MATEARLIKIEIDGIEVPIVEGEPIAAPDDETVAKVLEMMADIEEAERPSFILSTSTSHG